MSEINFDASTERKTVFEKTESFIKKQGLTIASKDESRPWGGFLVIDEKDSEIFIDRFFPQLTKENIIGSGKLSPKILIVAPGKRLSWQYHHRRAELWQLIGGEAGVTTSDNDEEKNTEDLSYDHIKRLKCGERHRLLGLNGWGIVAEIWQHTDPEMPSNEDDIVRVQDDFGR